VRISASSRRVRGLRKFGWTYMSRRFGVPQSCPVWTGCRWLPRATVVRVGPPEEASDASCASIAYTARSRCDRLAPRPPLLPNRLVIARPIYCCTGSAPELMDTRYLRSFVCIDDVTTPWSVYSLAGFTEDYRPGAFSLQVGGCELKPTEFSCAIFGDAVLQQGADPTSIDRDRAAGDVARAVRGEKRGESG
jgi:hypothetical protein